ncbi:Ig-like domain-containing protein [Gallibacterium anatis]|uniref:Ig-like domain-containing protein n=1 Tax=Gallibacterium anatis TaxID=750 RepID=UPI002550CA4F|nr:Ig-like domain-containing protein [Gallibacterium anatis]MDK9561501.1 Ig-like domain-containing protein [Gallibacterium anatis]
MGLILVEKKSGKRIDLSKVLKNGKYTELAVPGEEYYLIDRATGKTPEDIKVTRSGNDLILKSEKENVEVIIDDFWGKCDDEQQCFAIFDVGASEGADAGQVIVTQVGKEFSSFPEIEAGMSGTLAEGDSFSPWLYGLAGLTVLGLGAAAAGGSGGGSSAHSAPSDITPPSQPTDVVIKNDGKQITGKAEPGSKITIKDDQGNVIANGKADEQGNFSIDLNPPKNNGEKVEVTATDNAGNTSTPTDIIAPDSTSPNKPKNLDVSDDGTHVTGTAEPGSTVTVKDENGKEIGTATAGDNGKFDVTINPPKTNGEELTVEAKDEAGNPSQPNTVKADDSTPPTKPENLDVSDDGTRVIGTAEPGSTVTVKDEKDNVIGTGKANEEDGKFDITLDEPKTALEELSVTATDNANNESNSEKVTAPLVVPKTKPDFDYAVPVAGVDKLYNAKEVGTDGTITVKVIPNANIGDSISITRDGKTEVFKITTDNKNGIEVEVKPGSEISAFIIGANGVAGEIASKTLQNADVDVPNVKPIITFESTGTDNIYNIEEVKQDKPNTITATVKFPDAKVGDIVVVNGQETRITTENLRSGVEVEVEPNTEVKAYIKDDAGNQGFISTSIAPKADLEKPDAPIKVDVASDNSPADNVLTRNEINKNGEVPVRVYLPQGLEEGDKLIVTPSTEDKKGSPIEHPLTKAEIDQGYAIVDAPTGVDALGQGKVSFTAQLIDKAGNSSTEKDSDNYDVKRTLLGKPSVEYPDDKDNNQVLLGEELAGNTTSVKINLPNIGEGDTVSITINGEEYGVDVITQKVTHNDKTFEFKPATDDDGYTVTINDISIADGSVSEVVTNVVVTANNTELKANGTLCIDRSQPGGRDNNGDAKGDDKPTLEIPEAVNPSLEKDGNINAQELSDGVVAKVTLPEGVQAGDVIVIKNNGQELYTYTIPQGTTTTKGSVIEFSIPKEKLPSGAYELSASVKEPDSYGDKARESEDSDTVAFKVDNKIPGDSNGNGVVDGSDENSGQPIVTVTDAHTSEGQDKPVGNKDLEGGIQVEVTIPKGTEAGDTVEVTVKTPNGEVKKTAKVEEGDLPGTGDGKVTVTVPTEQLPKDDNGKVLDGDYSVTAKVTDPAGNSSPDSDEVTFAVDTTAPGDSNGDGKVDAKDKNAGKPVIDIPEATDADGNTINAGDLKDGVQVEVTLPGGVAAGDVVTLEVTTPNSNDPIKVTQTLESGDITAGKVTVDIPKKDLPKDSDGKVDGAYQVTATVSDKAGNTSPVSDVKDFTIDATVPGDTNGDGKADTNDINGKPSVSIPENADGGVTATEFNNGVQVQVTLPAGTQKGDTITLTVTPKGGEAFTVISAPISDSDLSTETATVTIPKDQFPETPKGDYTVSAQIKDAAGNQSLASVKKTFTVLDTVVPGDTNSDGVADSEDDNGGKPNVSVVDAHTSDNQDKPVGSDDLKDGVQVEVTLPKGTEVGDTVEVTVKTPNGETLPPITVKVEEGDLPGTGDGKVTVTVPNKQFPTDEKGKITEGEYKVTATVKDADGNTSQPSDNATFKVDTTVPGDSNGDGVVNEQDANGGKPVVAIPEATDADGNTINADDLKDGVQVKVTLPAGTQQGDQVYLTLTPEGKAPIAIEPPYQVQAEDLNGERTVEITIPKDILPKDAESGKTLDGNFTVTAQVKDAAGNTSQPSDKASFTVDTVEISGEPVVTIPEMDNNSVNASEFATAQGVDIKVTIPEGTQAGDTLTVTVSADGKAPITITKNLTAEDLNATDGLTIHIPASKESDQANSFPVKADGSYVVVAKVSDGTTTVESDSTSLVIDTTVPGDSNGDGVADDDGKPVVTIPEATQEDGYTINAKELADGDGVQVNVTLPKGTQVGDTVTLTVKPENGDAFTVPYTVKEVDDVSGNGTPVSVTIPKQHEDKDLNGAYTVTAVVTDAAGNSSATSDKAKFTVDATVPGDTTGDGVADNDGKPVVTIPEATGGVNADELSDGIKVQVTLPKGTQVGDTVTLTVKADAGTEQEVTYTVKQGDDVNGATPVEIPIAKDNLPKGTDNAVDGNYTVTAKVTDPAGNSSLPSTPANFTVDTTVPGDSDGNGVVNEQDANGGKPVVAVPEATQEDGYTINAKELADGDGVQVEVTLPQGTQVGDTVTLTVTPNEGQSFEVKYEVKSNDDLTGTDPVTITIPKQHNGQNLDGAYTVTAVVTDKAGNSSASSAEAKFTVDATVPGDTDGNGKADDDDVNKGKPTVTIPEATAADNHIVNAEDFKNGVQVQVTLPKGTQAGDTITLTIKPANGTAFTVPYTVEPTDDVSGNGKVTVNVPVNKFSTTPDGDYTVTAVVTDAAGNSSATSDAANFTIDITAPGDTNPAVPGVEEAPEVSIPEADNGVNDTEWNGGENQEGAGIQVKVTLPNGTRAGDTVTLTVTNADGTTTVFTTEPYKVLESDLTNGATITITIPTSSKLTDGDYHVTALVTDQAGNAGKASDPADFTLDTTATGKPTIEGFVSDNNPQDNIITRNEVAEDGSVQVKVKLPEGVKEGDVLYITPYTMPKENGKDIVEGEVVEHTITGSDVSSQSAIVSVPTGVGAGKEGTLLVVANILDKAGNDSEASNVEKIDVNRALEGKPNIVYTSDADQNGVLMGDEIANNVVPVEVNLPTVNADDTVLITINGDNTYTVDLSGDTKVIKHGDKTYTLTTKQVNGKTEYTTTINDVAVDANATSITSSIVVTPTSGEKTEASQTIQIDRNQPGGTTDADSDGKGDGKPSITIPEASNPSLDKDGKISAAELSDADGVVINVTVPAGTEAGDIIVIKNKGSEIYTFTIPADTTIGTDHPIAVTVPKDKFADGETYNITASVKEPYSKGARESEDSDQVTFTVDTTVPGDSDGDNKPDNAGKPVVTLPDGVKDGVNVKELSDGIKVKVTLPKGTQEGDTVILTVKADDGTEQEVTYIVKQGDDVNGATPVEIPIAKDNLPKGTDNAVDGNYTVTAKVTDPAGNSSLPSTPANFTVDTTVPGDSDGNGVVNEQDANGGKPVVAVPEATQEDGYTINAKELADGDGVQVNVTLPQGTQVGDTVTLTVKPENGDAFTVTYTVQPGDDVSGSGKPVSVTIPKQHKDKDLDGAYTVTAVVTDAVGNSSVTSDKAKFTVDATVPGDTSGDGVADDDGKPVVTIPENANGGVNATEFNDKGVQVNVTLPKGTQVGDTVTLTVKPASGNEFTVTYSVKDTDNVTGSVTVDIPTAKFPSNPDGAYTVTAKVTDPAGNSSKVSTPANFTVDTTVPGDSNGDGVADDDGKPVIESIPEATEEDGYSINATEFSNGIEVQVRLPQGTQVGDTVTLTLQPQTGNAITVDYIVQSGDLSGTDPIVTIPVEKVKFPEQADGEYTVTAQVKDPAGNNSPVSKGKTFTVDTQAPTVTQPVAKKDGSVVITLPNDADKVTVTVQPEGETKPRDITLTKGDDGSWTSSDPAVVPNVPNGSTTTTIPNDKVTDGSTVTVSAQDKAGNSHSESVNAVDVNDAPVLTIKPEDIVKTGFTKGQATAGKLIATVTATDPDKADTATIKLLNKDGYFEINSETGEISLTGKGAAFVNEGNNLPSIQVQAIDNIGLAGKEEKVNIADTIDTSNTLTITSNDGESVTGITDPLSTVEIRNANNEVVGRGTAGSDGRFTIKLTHEEVVSLGKENANQNIQADHNGDGELETYHTDEEGNYRYTVDSPIKTGETLTVTSTNSYDNRATEQSETPDKIAPSAPVIEINEQGTVISGIAEPGSTIVLQVTSKDGQTTQVATDKNNQPIIANEKGEFTIELKNPLIDKQSVTATAEDEAHNISPSSDSITAPYFNNELKDVKIGLRNDTGISDSDNITNDGGLKLVGDDNAMITKVEYKDAEGNYQTVPYVEGVYILPEGEYTAGTIRITQQDKDGAIKYSTNAKKFVIDTTAPDAATAVNDQNGNVTITLPHNAPKDDYVEVMVGNKKVTLTSDGNNGWTSSDTALVPTPRDNEVTILYTVAPSGTGVSVQSFDMAGNKAKKDSDNTLIDRTKITVALEHPEVNSNLMNDTDTTMVLNTAELKASGSPSNVRVKIYLPDSAQVGDYVEFPFGSSILKAQVKQTDIENGYFEVRAGAPMNFALVQGENQYKVKLYQSDKTTVKSESEPLLIDVDKLTPDTPVVTSKTGGDVTITLPTGERSNFDPSTSIGTQAEVDDWVIITAGDQSVKLTKTANGWEKPTEADWITINGNTATIPTNTEKFPYGTTVTAQAFDKAGNQSEQGVGHVVQDPLKFTDFKVNNQDLDTTTPNIVDTNQKAIYYTATVEGQEAEEAIIRVRLMKGDQQVEVHYLDISSDSQTYKGAFNNLSADYEQYKVIADIVHQDKSTGFNDVNLPERSVDVMVDNVVPQLDFSKIKSDVLDGPNKKPNSVTIVATDGSHTLKDGNNTVSGAAEMTMKLDFGNAQSDKQRIITDKLGNKVVVYNPKLDWMMRKDDDDDTSSSQYHNDHAQGWGFDTKTAVMYNQDKALFYKWNGDNEAADIIVSGMSRTDEWWSYYNRRGWIGAENTGSSATLTNKTMTQFVMDTLGGGADYISAPAIAGNVVIRTNDGDDMITTKNLQGRYDYYVGLGYSRPNVDGSNQIYMGDGNDTFEVTGTAKDTEDPEKAGAVRDEMIYASLYATNAKIDMGAGNDKVSIKWNVFTGSQQESGNYFNLGEGDDTMIVGGNVLGQLRETSYEGSTIINLGSGNDTLSLAKIERESNYSSPLVLITSKESANVTIGNVKEAQLSMMMGDGEDKVTISKDLILSGQKSDWISQVFLHNDEYARQGIERYKNFYDQALKDQINSSLVRAIDLIATDSQDRSATGGRAVVGADRVATSTSESVTEIIDVLDLGDGQNTLSVTGKMFGVNYFGGKDVDTIQSGVTENSRFWLGLGEDSVELAQMSNSAIYAGAGEDRITVGGIKKQEGRGSIISAEDGNDTIIINALPKTLVALEADKSWISGGNGDDTITINGDLFGTGNQIFGDAGNDTITISGNIRGSNNLIDGGAGNDTITLKGEVLKDLGGKFEIRGGEGNDTISVGNISTEDNVSIFAGNGNDIVTIKNVKGDNDHIIDLGEDVNKTDYDILSIEGSQSEGYNNQFSIGGRPSEHTQIWGAEEIRFTGTGVTVKIVSGNLVNNNTGPSPAGKDELFIHNGDVAGSNIVKLEGWTKSGGLTSKEFNGKTYDNVQEYHYSSSNGTSEDILYIQQGVTVEII